MAKFEFNADKMFSIELSTSLDKACQDALNATAPIMVESVKKAIKSVEGEYAKGSLVGSVSATKPKRARTDAYILVVRPKGKDKKGVRNMEKAMYLEYGTVKQDAKAWLVTATKNAEAKCLEEMQNAFNKAMGL